MAWSLSLIGEPALRKDEVVQPFPATGLLVAAYLATAPTCSATRAQIIALLWDGTGHTNGSGNLRQLISRLRIRQAELGIDLLRFESNRIRLNAEDVTVDVLLMEKARAAGEWSGSAWMLEACCRGEFMAGLEPAGEPCRSWLATTRSVLRRTFSEIVAAAVDGVVPGANRRILKEAAVRLIEADPYQEPAYQALMRILANERQFWQVKEVYERCRARLNEDLGIEPDQETVSLLRRLFNQSTGALPKSPDAPRKHSEFLPRVALLPPRPSATNPVASELGAAIIEDVTVGLCSAQGVSVVAPHTAERLGEIGRIPEELAIDYVVEGSVTAATGRPSVFVALVHTRSRTIVWSERHGIESLKLSASYDGLVRGIVGNVTTEVARSEAERHVPDHAEGAYQHYLTGRRYLRAMDLPSVRRARKCFKAAIAACPGYAAALAGLARTHHLEWLLLARGDMSELQKAREYAARAVEIDPACVHGLRELGLSNQFAGRFPDSLAAFERAEAASPQYADLLADHADALAHASDPASSLSKISRAIELNPLCPDDYWWIAGGANFHLGRYQDAVRSLKRMKDQAPAYRLMAASCAMAGEREEASVFVRKARSENPAFRVDEWMSVLPIRDPAQRARYAEGLRLAGFR